MMSLLVAIVCVWAAAARQAPLSGSDLTAALGSKTASEVKDIDTKSGERSVALGVITPQKLVDIQNQEKDAFDMVKKSYSNIKDADQPALDFLNGKPAPGEGGGGPASQYFPSYDEFADPDDPLLRLTMVLPNASSGVAFNLTKNNATWHEYRDKIYNKLVEQGKQFKKEQDEREEKQKELRKELDADQERILQQNKLFAASIYSKKSPCPCKCPRPNPCPCNVAKYPCAQKVVPKPVAKVATVSHCCHATKVVSTCCPSAHTLASAGHQQGEVLSAPNLPHTVKPDTVGYGKMPEVSETGVVMKKTGSVAAPAPKP